MRKYETVFISDPDLHLQDQARADLFDKVKNIIAQKNGVFLNFDEWGNKKLAYEINKKLRGHYTCVTYGGTGDLIKELERNFRLSDDVMKFMTLLLSDDVTAEQLEKEALEIENQSKQIEETEKKAVEEKVVEEETSKEVEEVEETEKKTE